VKFKIGYFSDLHVEFMKPAAKNARGMSQEMFARKLAKSYKDADLIIAAGDIGVGVDAIRFLKLAFPVKPVIYVPGNHEHYARELHANHAEMAAEAKGSNIHFFHDGGTMEMEGIRFVAATLWTDFSLLEPQVSSHESMMDAEEMMNDFTKIRIRHEGGMGLRSADYPEYIRASDLRALHMRHVENIKAAMRQALADGKLLVVVTHHAPCARSMMFGSDWVGEHLFQPVDPAYASYLDHLMDGEDAPVLWIHGHTHIAVDYTEGHTRVLSNPKGYYAGDDTGWELGKCLTLITH
jgi:predicted phosphodiesterase